MVKTKTIIFGLGFHWLDFWCTANVNEYWLTAILVIQDNFHRLSTFKYLLPI